MSLLDRFRSFKADLMPRFSKKAGKDSEVLNSDTAAETAKPAGSDKPPIENHSATEQAKFRRFRDLPPEIQAMVGAMAVAAEPTKMPEVIRNLSRVTRPEINHLVSDPGLAKALEQVDSVDTFRYLIEEVHASLYSKDGLSPRRAIDGVEPELPPGLSVMSAMGRWEHLNHHAKSKLISDILAVSSDVERSLCVHEAASHGHKIEEIHARPLVAEAMKQLKVSAQLRDYTTFGLTAQSLLFLNEHLTSKENLQFEQMSRRNSRFTEAFQEAQSVVGCFRRDDAPNSSEAKFGQGKTVRELSKAILHTMQNPDLDALQRNITVNSYLAALPAAIDNTNRIAAEQLKSNLSVVPGDEGSASSARRNLQRAERPRSSHEL